ncbi:asparagine synthase (glutamine-hydrolyzing) [Candidatus Woesearchaeota archaeon]|nr:asparagine synthase (glutamine-hydrolyzing) [Candidatus Woesearchaeota archaeon]
MCSICGIVGMNDRQLIKAMNDSMVYRGPDDQGYFSDDKLEFGHNRLSIIDLSEKGHQPMHNEDKNVWVIFNGEIYNFIKLREKLAKTGHKFMSRTDTEVIIHAYEEFGESFLEKIDGMFSIALYDKKKRKVVLARDRIGVKPFYYAKFADKFLFASEMKALMRDNSLKMEFNDYGLQDYFKFDRKSPIKSINELLPGHYLTISIKEDGIKISGQIEYWRPNIKLLFYQDEAKVSSELGELLKDSVKQRMVSDVPIALFFSGGIDSTILAFFAKKFHNNTLKAFTIGTKDRNEFEAAKRGCKALNLDYVPILLDKDQIINIVPTAIYHLEDFDPRNVELCILSYFLAKASREHGIKVVLCGEGADEIFCGYRDFFPDYFKGGGIQQKEFA